MSGLSAIEWTDATWNPVTGCDRVSPGCAHCYALTLAARLKKMGQPGYQRDGDPRTSGPGFGVTLHPHKLDEPLRWRKPRMVFVNSMSDLFHDEIPDDYIARVFSVMAAARAHTFQILTKRPERALAWFDKQRPAKWYGGAWPLPNVWLGVSIENSRYTYRADVLREIPAAVRFISAEPLLGSLFSDPKIEQHEARWYGDPEVQRAKALRLDGIDWVIVGGESGPGARPMHPEWAREIRDACLALCPDCAPRSVVDLVSGCDRGVRPAFFFKQWGAWADGSALGAATDHVVTYDGRVRTWPEWNEDGYQAGAGHARPVAMSPLGKRRAGRLLDGREWNEMPA